MKDRNIRLKNYIPYFVALLMAGMTLALFFSRTGKADKVTVDVVLLGDSIIGRQSEREDTNTKLSDLLGVEVYNCAFGGNRASYGSDGMNSDNMSESLCLVSLTDSICQNDFGTQKADMVTNLEAARITYFEDHLNKLTQVDFSKTKVLVLEFGTNDYNSGHPLDNSDNLYDCYTYGGALRYSVEKFQENYPEVQIVLVTPTFCLAGGGLCTEMDFGGGYLKDYADKMKEIGRAYNIPVVDMYTDMGIDENNLNEMTWDGIHLSEEGQERYCRLLAETIKQYL